MAGSDADATITLKPAHAIMVGGPEGPVLASRVVTAATFRAKLKGLLGRTGLEPGEGLWLVGTNGVHTFGMKFSIDVLFLDRHLRVLAIRAAMQPGRIARAVPGADSCLELAAGQACVAEVRAGDVLWSGRADRPPGTTNP